MNWIIFLLCFLPVLIAARRERSKEISWSVLLNLDCQDI
jgi:hypothetical protein